MLRTNPTERSRKKDAERLLVISQRGSNRISSVQMLNPPFCAYYLTRHKTTGARGRMSILCILVLVNALLTQL